MKQYYPDLYLETAGELMTLDYDQTELSEEESRFLSGVLPTILHKILSLH